MLCTKTLLQKQGNMIEMLISNQCAEKEMYRMPLLQIRKLHQYTERQLKPLLIVTRLIKRKIIKTCNWVSHETQSSHCLLKFCIFWKPISNNATELLAYNTSNGWVSRCSLNRYEQHQRIWVVILLLEMRTPMICNLAWISVVGSGVGRFNVLSFTK